MSIELIDTKLTEETSRLTWITMVKNVSSPYLEDFIPMDEKWHEVKLKYLSAQLGISQWVSIAIDGFVIRESSTDFTVKEWRNADVAMLIEFLLGEEFFVEFLD